MKVNAIKNLFFAPAKKVANGVQNPIQTISKVNLNQPATDMFVKGAVDVVKDVVAPKVEPEVFELPKDKEFKKPVMATKEKPYCQFDEEKVDLFVKAGEKAIPTLSKMLNEAKSEEDICEGLYIANAMAMNDVKGVDKMYYGTFSKFNDNKSPNVQSFLSGVYRRILVPDSFGPLVKMLADNIKEPPVNPPFDPNESIGGAILDLIKAPKINPL